MRSSRANNVPAIDEAASECATCACTDTGNNAELGGYPGKYRPAHAVQNREDKKEHKSNSVNLACFASVRVE